MLNTYLVGTALAKGGTVQRKESVNRAGWEDRNRSEGRPT